MEIELKTNNTEKPKQGLELALENLKWKLQFHENKAEELKRQIKQIEEQLSN